MPSTGLQVRQRILRNTRGALGFLGKSTATAGGTDRLRDALRFDMNTLSQEDISGAFIRITQAHSGTATATAATTLTDSAAPFINAGLPGALVTASVANGGITVATITSNTTSVLTMTAGWSNGTPTSTSAYTVTYGHIAKVIEADITTGDIYFDPAVTTAVVTGAEYELWFEGIRPDHVDESRDLALATRNSVWKPKPLSVIKEVADWTTSGASNATAVPTTLDFPQELFDKSMLVTNSGAAGYIPSESYYVQPTQTLRIFGWVSTRAQTASIRLRDVTSSADITLSGTSTFTLRGWQGFDVTAVIPTSCAEVQLWLGGASASCIAEWAGVGVMPQHKAVFSHESRVLSKHDLGVYYAVSVPTSVTGDISRSPINGVRREQAGDGVLAVFDSPPNHPVYYQERHRYAALQSDYMSLVNRATGDATSTDCNIDYIAWATVVELLEARQRSDTSDRLLKVAYKNLSVWDDRVGANPTVVPEFRTQGGIPILSL